MVHSKLPNIFPKSNHVCIASWIFFFLMQTELLCIIYDVEAAALEKLGHSKAVSHRAPTSLNKKFSITVRYSFFDPVFV